VCDCRTGKKLLHGKFSLIDLAGELTASCLPVCLSVCCEFITHYDTALKLSLSLSLSLSLCLSLSLSLSISTSIFPGEPGLADFSKLRMTEMVVTTGATSHAKLQSNCHCQQTNTHCFTDQMHFLSPPHAGSRVVQCAAELSSQCIYNCYSYCCYWCMFNQPAAVSGHRCS